jgi:UDP-N-acetyl-D-mannosaminuronate dehydrogenase
LARDVAYLNKISKDRHLTTPLLSSITASNDEHKRWVTRKLQTLVPELGKATVAVWGLTYKAGTDTLRRSMAVELGISSARLRRKTLRSISPSRPSSPAARWSIRRVTRIDRRGCIAVD